MKQRLLLFLLPLLALALTHCKKYETARPHLSAAEGEPNIETNPGEGDPEPTHDTDDLLPPAKYTAKRVWRLTPAQLGNTVKSLLNKDAFDLPSKFDVGAMPEEGFGNESEKLTMDSVYTSKLETIFGNVLLQSPNELIAYSGCKDYKSLSTKCVDEFVQAFGAKAFRRDLTDEEVKRYKKVYTTVKTSSTGEDALAAAAEAILRSPHMIFRSELGIPSAYSITSEELSSTLAYGITDLPPDEKLLSAAKSGELTKQKGIEDQVTRLIASDGFLKVYTNFLARYTGVYWITKAEKNAGVFPGYTFDMLNAMTTEFEKYAVANIKDKKGSFKQLLTSNDTEIKPVMNVLYRLEDFPSEKKYTSDAKQRAGLFTLPAVISANSPSFERGTIHRGNFLARRLTCVSAPPPPPGVATEIPNEIRSQKITNREKFMKHATDPKCANCHKIIDPFGFSFEHYNAVGQFDEKEDDLTINASGVLSTAGKDIPFKDATELMRVASESEDVQKCFVKQVFRFTFGRSEKTMDNDLLGRAQKAFQAADYDVREIFKTFYVSKEFRYRSPN